MGLLNSITISASALTAQRERIDTVVSNLANARTTRTPEGGPYRRRDVVFEAVPADGQSVSFESTLSNALRPIGVRVAEIVLDPTPPMLVHDPGHPDANDEGYVALPNVNPVEETVNLISASRAFEASVSAITVSEQLIERSLDIARS